MNNSRPTTVPDSAARGLAHSIPRRFVRRRGVVLVITLFAIILIAALLAYVVNLGRQANSRIVVQNAADATVISGAGWVARTLNTVSMNNVSISRLISLVNVLDAMPQAVDYTLKDQQAIYDAVTEQIAGQKGRTGVSDKFLLEALTKPCPSNYGLAFVDEMKNEIDLLKPVNQALNGGTFDMRDMTFYNGPSGKGQIWLAMEGLDNLSQAMVENVSLLAQTNACLAGMGNTGHDVTPGGTYSGSFASTTHGTALLLPATPTIPFTHGAFDDFNRPVSNGLLPTDIDDKTTNRGPFDSIFGWRVPVGGGYTGGSWVPGNSSVLGGGRGTVPIGRGASGNGGHMTGGQRQPDAYAVFGPHGWLLRQISGIQRDQLRQSRFGYWEGTMASMKLSYMWPGDSVKQLVEPHWITDLSQAFQLAQSAPASIVETCFIAVEIKSKYPRGDSKFHDPGTWALDDNNGAFTPRIVRAGGWVDPNKWTATKIDNAIWRDEWSYKVAFDNSIGIIQQLDPVTKQPIPQDVYRIDSFILVGVNDGKKADIRNPSNFSDRSKLPAPTNADPTQLKDTKDSRRKFLTFMSVAVKPDEILMWPSRFSGGKMEPANFAIAEAKVFNDHSWDLWTQMWRVQMEPVSDFNGWTAQIDDVSNSPPDGLLLNASTVDTIRKYMHSVEGLAPVMLNH